MIPVSDLEKTRRFYEDVLGFTPDIEDPGGISYRSGSGRFNIYPTQFAGTAQHKLIGWHTDDIEKAGGEAAASDVVVGSSPLSSGRAQTGPPVPQ